MIKLTGLNKTFQKDGNEIKIFGNLNIEFHLGKIYAIIGESGVGKSTLINILGLLDTFESGNYFIDNMNTKRLSDKKLSKIRMQKIGLIFQDYYLNPRLTAKENVIIATFINPNIKRKEREKKALELLKQLHIEHRANHYPNELSGGEQQRVCIARALINNPSYILADEPTGSLDYKNVNIILDILKSIKASNRCVIMVTHDLNIAKLADVTFELKEHKLIEK